MSDQPGFRQPEPQPSPDYQSATDPYISSPDQPTDNSVDSSASQTERMPTYPPSSSEPPNAQPVYGQPSPTAGAGYAQPTPPGYGQAPQDPYGAGYGQAPQDPYGAGYGQAPQDPYGYGQQPYGQAGQSYGMAPYGQPAYGYAQPEHPQATTILVLGILGFFVPIVPFVAWYMGGQIKRQIEAGAPYQWEGTLKIGYLMGKILGIIQIVSLVLTIAWVIFAIGIFATSGF